MASLQLSRFARVEDFYPLAEPFLVEHEAENNLLLGICGTLLKQPMAFGEPLYFAAVQADGEVVAVALRTPPHNVVLSPHRCARVRSVYTPPEQRRRGPAIGYRPVSDLDVYRFV